MSAPPPDFAAENARLRRLFNEQARLIRRIHAETFRADADLMTVRDMIDPTFEEGKTLP